MNNNSNNITFAEKVYFGSFFVVFLTSGLPMLANATTYNAKMNQFGKLLGGDTEQQYDVDSMPWRLRHKLIQDITAFSAGILTTILFLNNNGGDNGKSRKGSNASIIMLVTITTFDLLGSVTSGITLARTKLKAEWMPVVVHGLMGIWGLHLCTSSIRRK